MGTKKMSLTEFMADESLGSPSWIEDNFDITSSLNSNNYNSPSLSPSPFGDSNRFDHNNRYDSRFDSNRNYGFGNNRSPEHSHRERDRDRDFPDLNTTSWRNTTTSSIPSSSHPTPAYNMRNTNIVVFDNIPSNCTRQLIKELFESRYTKLETCHVLLDPSDPTHKKKLAFIFLFTSQDMQKVLKWNGNINIERMRFVIDSATPNEFQSVLQFNAGINYNEDAEDERIEKEERESRVERNSRERSRNNSISAQAPVPTIAKPKINPFGNAKPVAIPEIPIISENTKDIAKALELENNRRHSQPKINPFGNAKPVIVPEIPITSENTAEIAKSLDINSQLSPHKSNIPPQQHPKVNPFGNAKPVDTLSKQLEIEKKISKAAINETTFDMTLIHEKANEAVKEGEEASSSSVKILKRRDSIDPTKPEKSVSIPSTASSTLSAPSSKGVRLDRRIARDVSEEEYEKEMKKRNQQIAGNNGNGSMNSVSNKDRLMKGAWRTANPPSSSRYNGSGGNGGGSLSGSGGYKHNDNGKHSNQGNNQGDNNLHRRDNEGKETKDNSTDGDKVAVVSNEEALPEKKEVEKVKKVEEAPVKEDVVLVEEATQPEAAAESGYGVEKEKNIEEIKKEKKLKKIKEKRKEKALKRKEAVAAARAEQKESASEPVEEYKEEVKEPVAETPEKEVAEVAKEEVTSSKESPESGEISETAEPNEGSTRGGRGRGRGRGRGSRGHRGFGGRGRGGYAERSWREKDEEGNGNVSGATSSRRGRGGSIRGTRRGGYYPNLVYHKPTTTEGSETSIPKSEPAPASTPSSAE